jgi:phospholipid-binding lipoprotein MlaA
MIDKIKSTVVILLIICLTACGTLREDPFEPVNRKVFSFNMAVDRAVFRPVAKAYDTVVPPPVAHGIYNFFDNLDDLTNIANNTLQVKFYDAWSDCWRFFLNSTFGIFGFFDVATRMGLPKHHQDFGLTLAYWGMTEAPYIMVPFFGPSTFRDVIGWSVDWEYLSIWGYIRPNSLRYSLYAVRLIQKRAALLPADKLIDQSLDPYVFVRDGYLQKRNAEIKNVRCCNNAPTSEDVLPDSDNGEKIPPKQSKLTDTDDTYVEDVVPNKTTKTNSDDTYVEP